MHIDRIDLYHVAMPLIYPWRTAYGEDASIESLLCRITSGSLDAWGEAAPFAAPCYSADWAGGIFAVAKQWLAPALVGERIDSGTELQKQLAMFKGNLFARGALDTAWWALESKRTGKPLHRLLGAQRDTALVGADFGVNDTIDQLLEQVGAAVQEGFARVKLKFRPGWDVDMLRAVRDEHPKHPIHIDCNSGYRLDDLVMFQQLDEFGLEMIEQPLQHDDLNDHARLQASIETALCLDESITTPRGAKQAAQLGSCRWINVKPGRVGGLTQAVAIHDVCKEAGIPCWVGGMLESATGSNFCIALGMLDNFKYPADIFPSSRFYVEDLSDPPIELEKDEAGRPCVCALEVLPEPVLSRLERLTVQQATVQ